ncbi:hypothetical protein EBZ80_00975 [bacterium]|nr:hypothetical protein [bacterium]
MQHRIALFAALLPAVVACGRIDRQAGALLGLADEPTSDRNAYLMFSKGALEDMIRVPVDETREINEIVSDVSVWAKAATSGKVGIELIPSAEDARFVAVVDANTHLDISGSYDPRSDIHIEMSGIGDVSTNSRKPVEIRLQGAVTKPAEATFISSLEVSGVNVTATGWFAGYKRRQAEKQAWATINQQLPGQQHATGNRVANELRSVLDERAGHFLLNLNATLVRAFREWFVESGYLPGKQLFQSTKDAIWFSSFGHDEAQVATIASRGAIEPPARSPVMMGEVEAPIMIGGNSFALENAAEKALGGRTFPAAAVSQLLVAIGASAAPPVWTTFKYAGVNLTFAKQEPLKFKFEEGRMTISANFESITQQAIRQAATSMELTWEVNLADDHGIKFVRVGEPVLKALAARHDPSRLLREFTEEALARSLYESFQVPVPDLSNVIPAFKRLRMTFVHVEEGWIRLGASLDAISQSPGVASR